MKKLTLTDEHAEKLKKIVQKAKQRFIDQSHTIDSFSSIFDLFKESVDEKLYKEVIEKKDKLEKIKVTEFEFLNALLEELEE